MSYFDRLTAALPLITLPPGLNTATLYTPSSASLNEAMVSVALVAPLMLPPLGRFLPFLRH